MNITTQRHHNGEDSRGSLDRRAATLDALSQVIGSTPLLGIRFSFRGRERTLYAKIEQCNITGSTKDRMALHILKSAYANGELEPGMTIAEATSGNTGIAFAALGRALGHPVKIFMPEWMSRERKELMRSYGAEILEVTALEGGFLGSIQRAEEYGLEHSTVFLPRQFSNPANAEAHEFTTGPEIWEQLEACGLMPEAFVAGVGTGGTVMGVGRCLRRMNPGVRVHPVEPAESPTLSTGHRVGKHRIQGISDEFVPAIMDLTYLDDVLAVSDGDSILMAQKLASELGLGVGISSGCNFLAAVQAQERLGADAVVVTVFADDIRRYLSTDLLRPEPCRPGFISPEVHLLGLSTLAAAGGAAYGAPGRMERKGSAG